MSKCIKCHDNIKENNQFLFTCGHQTCNECINMMIITDISFAMNKEFKCLCQNGKLQLSFEDIEKILLKNSINKQKQKNVKCHEKHNNMKYFCKNCKIEVCDECIKKNNIHKYHEYIEISKMKSIISSHIQKNLKFKNFKNFADYFSSNKISVIASINKEYGEIISSIKGLITDLNIRINQLSIQKEKKIGDIYTFIRILSSIYKKYYDDLETISTKSINEIYYLSQIKYDFTKILFPSSPKLNSECEKSISKLKEILLSPNIDHPSFVFSKLKHQNFPFELNERPINECKNMIKTKYQIGNIEVLSSDTIAFGSGSVIGDCNDNTIQIFNLKQSKFSHLSVPSKNSISSITLLTNDRIAAGSFDKTISIITLSTLKTSGVLKGHHSYINSITQINDNTIASSSSDGIIIWDINSYSKKVNLTLHSDTVYAVVYDPLKHFLFSCSGDKSIIVWDINNNYKNISSLYGHTSNIICICLLQNSDKLATGSKDQNIRIWNKNKFKCIGILHGHKGYVFTVKELIDHRVVSGSGDKTIRIWNVTHMTCVKVIKAHDGSVLALGVLNDGKIASGGKDNCMKIWD